MESAIAMILFFMFVSLSMLSISMILYMAWMTFCEYKDYASRRKSFDDWVNKKERVDRD